MRATRLVLLLVALLFAAGASAQTTTAPAWTTVSDHWYTLEIGGAPAGWAHTVVTSDGSRYRSVETAKFKLSRGPVTTEIEMGTTFVETHAGVPVTLETVQDTATQIMTTTWTFGEAAWTLETTQGGRTMTRDLPVPDDAWLTPMAAQRFFRERAEAGADEFSFRTIDGESGTTPTEIHVRRVGTEEFITGDRTIPVDVWSVTSSAMPTVSSTTKTSRDGYMVEEGITLPFGQLVTRISTREAALALDGGPGPELMISMFVRADKPIRAPRRLRAATYRVRVKEGAMPDLPTAGAQTVSAGDDAATATIRVDVDRLQPADAGAATDATYLEPSALVDAGDALVAKLAERAVRGAGDDPAARAEALRRFVHRHISGKALDTAFASASETARTRTGDCSEHGTLLCAMLRANGIPARVATGLIYVEDFLGEQNIFGWHMWTQALVDGTWVDLDATLDTRYDAAHILTGTSSLADTSPASEMSSLLVLLGNLEVEVADLRYEGN